MQQRQKKLIFPLLISCALILLMACGRSRNRSDEAQEQQEETGAYQASLTPLNSGVAGSTTGLAEITIFGDELMARVEVNASPAGVIHQQMIHAGGACPGAEADANGDGYIDAQEALAVSGGILIPLNNRLEAQRLGTIWPVANSHGNYVYRQTTSFVRMMADLRAPDPIPGDEYVKLAPEENINLEGRTVIIYGVGSGRSLPASVASRGGQARNRTLPIACGVFRRATLAVPVEPAELPPPVVTPPTVIIITPTVPAPTTRAPQVPWYDSFSTRLSPTLAVWGKKCVGGERITRYYRERVTHYICATNQWIVHIDNVNTCDEKGCTELQVEPFIANLALANVPSPPNVGYYHIRPVTPVPPGGWEVVKQYWVKFELNGSSVVEPKP